MNKLRSVVSSGKRFFVLVGVMMLNAMGSAVWATGASSSSTTFTTMENSLQNIGKQALGFVTGPIFKLICVVLFVAAGIAYAYAGDNEKLKSKLVKVIVAIIIVFSAGAIVGMVFDTSFSAENILQGAKLNN